MRKSRSKSERDYKQFYRWLRLTGGSYSEEDYPFGLTECQDCAILSYDNHDSEFSGWINRQRMQKFKSLQPSRVAPGVYHW